MGTTEIQILHTNDLHSHLEQWPKMISLINEKRYLAKLKGCEVLVFDIGDHSDRVHPITEATLGKANVELMNEVGYHSATIGNNEGITLSKESLSELYERANFPVLVANLFHENGERPDWLKPYEIIKMTKDLTVGVIGMTIPFKPFYHALGWLIEDPFQSLPAIIKTVREQADIVIFLSHLGLNFDEQVANQIAGIDIILGAHTHHVLESGMFVNESIIHQAGKFGQYVGQLSITYDNETKKITGYEAKCVVVNDFPADHETEKKIAILQVKEQKNLEEKVTSIEEGLPVSWLKSSPFAVLLAAALKDWCGGEIGMVNSGTLLDSLKAGPVTKADLHRVCPHPINPCKVEISGAILKETIQYVLSEEIIYKEIRGFGFRGKVFGFMEFDGVTYEMKLLNDGLTHITNIKINGRPINLKRTYEVATLDMFTFGHLFPAISAAKIKKYYMPELLRDLLAWKLKKSN
ncbi:bifunctional UDP-sugar hydrolase/5'-nucleotidase [Bacillaceae bacterium IKA-2]|nr:bifunctional UDP-sugar hydrolase/5'-nucleotidase [Bacillaceae bacterium IKA-2]